MKKLNIILIAILLKTSFIVKAQISVNTDGSNADNSAMLDVKSTEKGFLPPRLTTLQRDAIGEPANGLTIYNITTGCMEFYLAGVWEQFCSGTGSPMASFTIGTGSSCDNTSVNGNYYEGVGLDGSNTLNLDVTTTSTGSWSITTNTENGYSFSGSGTFASTGTVQVTLNGTGTPIAAQANNFTSTANGTGGTCTFSVTVSSAPTCGLPISYGGLNYNTVQIGAQCWMAENLNIGIMINGVGNQTDNATIEKYCYDNNTTNCNTYGGLYQWDEMMQYITIEGTQGICPNGWHLPTNTEWCTLENEVDIGTISCGSTGWRGTNAGGNLKETGTSHWLSSNTGATNSSGFTGLPAGYRGTDGSFSNLTLSVDFWTSSEDASYAWYRYLYYGSAQVGRNDNDHAYGFSVRCVQD